MVEPDNHYFGDTEGTWRSNLGEDNQTEYDEAAESLEVEKTGGGLNKNQL